jgi:hypothetical protein
MSRDDAPGTFEPGPDAFCVPDRVFFLAPDPLPTAMPDLLAGIVGHELPRSGGGTAKVVLAFSDQDLAQRYADRYAERGVSVRPIAGPTAEHEMALYVGLRKVGYSHLAFDPRPGHATYVSLNAVIEKYTRQAPPGPAGG